MITIINAEGTEVYQGTQAGCLFWLAHETASKFTVLLGEARLNGRDWLMAKK